MALSIQIITGLCIFSYLNCWEPKAIMGSNPKYSVSLIIPKTAARTVGDIRAAIQAAYEAGRFRLKGSDGSVPALADIHIPLRDGDKERPGDKVYEGCWFINANSYDAPKIVDADCKPIKDHSEMYSGVKGRASIGFYAYNVNGNCGIACALNGLQKISNGDPLGGKSSDGTDFTPYDGRDDDEDFLN